MKQLPVWTEEEVRHLIVTGIDRERLDALHSQAMYALTSTVKDRGGWRTTGNSLWPVYLDYVPSRVEIGNSRKILNTSRILLSEFSGNIVPETKGVDDTTNQLRQQAWCVRAKGDGMGDGGWDIEMAQQYTDFRELGTGAVCHDEILDENGLEYATLRHFRATDVIYDPSVRNPLRAKWYCRRTPFTKFEAIALFGKDKVTVNDLLPMGGSHPLEIVWYYEFFSVPFAGRRETYCSFIGFPGEGVCDKTPRTARSKQLNVSWGVNYLPSASRWPIGGIWLQCATQALMGNLEQKFKKASDRQSMTAVDLAAVKGRNLAEAQKSGWLEVDLSTFADGDIRKAVTEISGGTIDAGDLNLYELAQRQYNEDSGTTEQMRGNLSEQDRTLGEQQLAQAGAEKGQSYEKVQALAMTSRVVEKVFSRMRVYDRSPLTVDLDGYDITLNDPDDSRFSLENVFRDKGEVSISPGSFSMADDRVKRAQRAAELSDPNLVMLVGKPGGVSPEWFRDEVMKTKGANDPNAYKMPDQAAPGAMSQLLGMMGTQAVGQ